MFERIDPALLLGAYSVGVFPMADSRDAPTVYWVEPRKRGILGLENFQLSRSLRKTIVTDRFRVTTDTAFDRVVELCAEAAANRPDTWINPGIAVAFSELHHAGLAHSVECWDGDQLAGGLYGLALGRAFFGESMVSRERDASKVALAWLVARMRVGKFTLLDCQFITPHLASLGAREISRANYLALLKAALSGVEIAGTSVAGPAGDFGALDRLGVPGDAASAASPPPVGKVIAQLLTQTS
jgi:leucyl/phenylalanyl-tRNA--protein transferase